MLITSLAVRVRLRLVQVYLGVERLFAKCHDQRTCPGDANREAPGSIREFATPEPEVDLAHSAAVLRYQVAGEQHGERQQAESRMKSNYGERCGRVDLCTIWGGEVCQRREAKARSQVAHRSRGYRSKLPLTDLGDQRQRYGWVFSTKVSTDVKTRPMTHFRSRPTSSFLHLLGHDDHIPAPPK